MKNDRKNADQLEVIGINIARYGLVLVLLWVGAMKFTAVEAKAIEPLVANSPFMGWVYNIMSVGAFAALLGVIEIIIAFMIALRSAAPLVSAIGSGLAAVMFVITLTFLFSTPGWEPTLGFPALSVVPGQFIIKDAVLLGVSLWTAGEAWKAAIAARSNVGVIA